MNGHIATFIDQKKEWFLLIGVFPHFFCVFLFHNFTFIYNFSFRSYIIKTSHIIPYKASEIESFAAKINNIISDENDENVIKSLYYDINELNDKLN